MTRSSRCRPRPAPLPETDSWLSADAVLCRNDRTRTCWAFHRRGAASAARARPAQLAADADVDLGALRRSLRAGSQFAATTRGRGSALDRRRRTRRAFVGRLFWLCRRSGCWTSVAFAFAFGPRSVPSSRRAAHPGVYECTCVPTSWRAMGSYRRGARVTRSASRSPRNSRRLVGPGPLLAGSGKYFDYAVMRRSERSFSVPSRSSRPPVLTVLPPLECDSGRAGNAMRGCCTGAGRGVPRLRRAGPCCLYAGLPQPRGGARECPQSATPGSDEVFNPI